MCANPLNRLLVRCDDGTACSRFHCEIAKRHALFNGKCRYSRALVFNDTTQSASGRDCSEDKKRQIFRRGSRFQLTIDTDQHGLGKTIDKCLRRQNVFNFGRTDTKGKSSQCAVRRRVTVAANHHHTGTHQTLFVHQYVFNALRRIIGTVERRNAEVTAILGQV